MTKPKVSIIVPVYNTQDTLEECMNSLLTQTLQDIEIILVDDGSTDESGRLCDTYLCDPRVKVIHKDNGGLSSARNAGLDAVTGEYIGFVDSDDYVDATMFEKMYKKICSSKADVCICAHYTVDDEGDRKEHFFEKLPNVMNDDDIKGKVILPLIGKNVQKGDYAMEGFVCRNIYKRSLVENKRFLSEREYFAEDVVFNLSVYAQCRCICVLNECLYFYRYNAVSLSNKYRRDVEQLLDNLLNWEWNYMKEYDIPNEEYCRLYTTGIKLILFSIQNLKKKTCPLILREKKEKIQQMLNYPMFRTCLKKVEMKGFNWKMKVFIVLCKLHLTEILIKI